MKTDLLKSQANLGFHLHGDSYIDAELLSRTIHDVVELTKLAALEENPDAYLKMNVTAFKNGSFQIDFSAICEIARNLFTVENINIASGIISTVVGFFEIKKHLKGKAPKSVTPSGPNLKVENEDGDVITVSRSSGSVIYNIKMDQLVVNVAADALEHNPNGGFTLSAGDFEFTCNKDDASVISKPLPIEESTTCKRYTVEDLLPIKKADILGKSAWSFIYKDRVINATIGDDDFLRKIHTGSVSIHAGDYIEATIQIFVDLDENGSPMPDTAKYTIIQVKGDIKNDKNVFQLDLWE